MDYGQPEQPETNGSYQPQPKPPVVQQSDSALTTPRSQTHSKAIIITLALLLAAALATIAYLLFAQDSQPVVTTPSGAAVEQREGNTTKDDVAQRVHDAIQNPKPLLSVSYEGWKAYPADGNALYLGLKNQPTTEQAKPFGDITFSFPSSWRYMEGIDTRGISSRPRDIGEAPRKSGPYASLTFGWWPTDNSNGFEDAVVAKLNNVLSPGRESNPEYTHTLREIGTNSHGKMTAIIDYSYQQKNTNSESVTYKGVLGIIDDAHPTYSYSNRVSLASGNAKLAADPYQGAKKILSMIQCVGENSTDAQLDECIGIIKSYNKPTTPATSQKS